MFCVSTFLCHFVLMLLICESKCHKRLLLYDICNDYSVLLLNLKNRNYEQTKQQSRGT